MKVFAFSILILSSGCFPMHAIVRRPYMGSVVDSRTGAPIEGARVVIESWQVQAPPGDLSHRWLRHSIEVKTDASGKWQVEEEKDWTWAVLAADGFPAFTDSACVEARGYQPTVVNPWRSEGGPAPREEFRDEIARTKVPERFVLAPGEGHVARSPNLSSCGIPLKAPSQDDCGRRPAARCSGRRLRAAGERVIVSQTR